MGDGAAVATATGHDAASAGTDAAPSTGQPGDDLEALLAAADDAESSAEEGEGDFITEEELQGPPSEDLARRLVEQEQRELQRIQRLRRQKKRLKVALAAFKQKEKEFVAQMDAHMDEVERTEHDLSKRIDALTTENQQLRELTDRRARENSEQVEKLNETTKQCGESETRVQFLVDRIVALLSAGAADPAQTEAVMNLRQREREMLRQLEDTRQQFDEVRQQNGELTSRLTEELSLSRRLSDQLAEVEERFFHQKPEERAGRMHCDSEAPLRAAPRLGARPLGLRSDQLEAPSERPERAHPPDLPPPISEAEDECVDDNEVEGSGNAGKTRSLASEEGCEDLDEEPAAAESPGSVQQGSAWLSAGPGDAVVAVTPPSARSRAELMEAKLRDALDKAAFECAVVRIEPGLYNFGPSVEAVVELTEEEEVIASRLGGPFEPIDDFIRRVADEGRHSAGAGGQLDAGAGSPRVEEAAQAPQALQPPLQQPQLHHAPQPQPQGMPQHQAVAAAAASAPQRGEPAMSPRAVSPAPLGVAARYLAQASPRPTPWQGGPAVGAAAASSAVAAGGPQAQSPPWAVTAVRPASPVSAELRGARPQHVAAAAGPGVLPSMALPSHAGPMLLGHQPGRGLLLHLRPPVHICPGPPDAWAQPRRV